MACWLGQVRNAGFHGRKRQAGLPKRSAALSVRAVVHGSWSDGLLEVKGGRQGGSLGSILLRLKCLIVPGRIEAESGAGLPSTTIFPGPDGREL
jgi:hypothetical protein